MSHAKSNSKPDNSKPKSPPPLTVYYTNVRGLRGNFTDLETLMLKNNPEIFALCETNLHGDIQDSPTAWILANPSQGCWDMHGIGVYVKSNLLIAREAILERMKTILVFSFGDSTFYDLLFLYRSPSCSVAEAVTSNIDKALILQPAANIMVW